MKLLIIDNYDSFVYNLVHLVMNIGDTEVTVKRNDKIELSEVADYDLILLSPGPGIPSEAGLMPEIIKQYHATKNILGVCLGHQAIGECFGAKLTNITPVLHGVASEIKIIDDDPVFEGLSESFHGGHYHSWVVEKEGLPDELIVTSESKEGYIMSLRHKEFNIVGLQFHPESILTGSGRKIMKNWLTESNGL